MEELLERVGGTDGGDGGPVARLRAPAAVEGGDGGVSAAGGGGGGGAPAAGGEVLAGYLQLEGVVVAGYLLYLEGEGQLQQSVVVYRPGAPDSVSGLRRTINNTIMPVS